MTTSKILLVSGEGDPTSPRTWSGTPRNLMEALREIGCDVVGYNLRPSRPLRASLCALSLAFGSGKEFRRTPVYVLYGRMRMANQAAPDTVTLHMGLCTMPHRRKKGDGLHAVYLDTTFDMIAEGTLTPYSEGVRRRYERFEINALRAADHVFTVSECARENLIEHYSLPTEKVCAVGTGVGSIQPTEEEKDYSTRTVLFVAKQRFEEKGGLLLLQAFRIAQAADQRLKLIVVATEPYRAMVEELPGASFKSNLSWDDLQALFNTSSLFAMPAIYEPWGLVYLEAMLCRTPILGLNRNAIPEFTQGGKCGFIVGEATPEAVAATLCDAFSDTDRLAHMGHVGQQFVRSRYSWHQTALRMCAALSIEVARPIR